MWVAYSMRSSAGDVAAVHVRMTRGTAKSAAITRRTTIANIIKISYPGMMAPFRRVLAPK